MSKGGVIQLRDQQSLAAQENDPAVCIFAPQWVTHALQKLSEPLKQAVFQIEPPSGKHLTISEKLSLKDLLAIARNERVNVTGIIDFSLYNGLDNQTVIALRDLVKHCVIVGKDVATHFGGYGGRQQPLNQEVYICDLPALQFQELYNSGRHVLIAEQGILPKGLLDDDIFQNTVGEAKATFEQASQDSSGRYLKGRFQGKPVLFDTAAYSAFVAQDFILSALALNQLASSANPADRLNFKFLKYGTGFFAASLEGDAIRQLPLNLAKSIESALETLLKLPPENISCIKRLELPFYSDPSDRELTQVLARIESICQNHHIEFSSKSADALAPTSKEYKTATTNCSDPHAPLGNEMHHGSVDAAIAQNLKRKGNNFSPICNPQMKEQYINVPHLNAFAELKSKRGI